MRVSDPDLRLLRVFHTVVRCGSFAAAQEVLNVTQSTVSNHIAALEQRVGYRVCDRGRAGFKLTHQGESLFLYSEQLFASIEEFQLKTSNLKGEICGELRIGVIDNTATDPSSPLVTMLSELAALGDGVRLSVMNADPLELQRRLLEGRLDAAIGNFECGTPLESQPLYQETQGFYCGTSHAIRRLKKPSIADVERYPLVRRAYKDPFDMEFFGKVPAGATANSMEAALALILTGAYLGFLPDHLAQPEVHAGRLHRLDIPSLGFVAEICMLYRKKACNTALHEALIQIARKLGERNCANARIELLRGAA